MGEKTIAIPIEDIAKGMGIENVKVVDPFAVKLMINTIKEFLKKDKVSVIVAKRECQLLAVRKKRHAGIKIPKFEIDQSKCKKAGICLHKFACPAIYQDKKGNYKIDVNLCTGCGVCAQICPNQAIRMVKE